MIFLSVWLKPIVLAKILWFRLVFHLCWKQPPPTLLYCSFDYPANKGFELLHHGAKEGVQVPMVPQATFSILAKKMDLDFSWNLGQSDKRQVSFVALICNFGLNFKQTWGNSSFGFKWFHMALKCRSFSLNFSWESEFAQSWKSELNLGVWTHLD